MKVRSFGHLQKKSQKLPPREKDWEAVYRRGSYLRIEVAGESGGEVRLVVENLLHTKAGHGYRFVFRKDGAPATAIGNFGLPIDTNELSVGLARTAAFFSNNQAPLSTRTVRFISGVHFPPGIRYTGNAALYGIENTNRGCPLQAAFIPGQEVPPARSIDGTGIAMLPAWLVDEDLQRRALRLVLPGWETEPVAVHALHRREHRGSARVRALVEHLRAAYRRSGWR